MQVQNSFQPVRFAGPSTHSNSFAKFTSDTATACFDGSFPQGKIRLPLDNEAHQHLMDTVEFHLTKKQKSNELEQAKQKEADALNLEQMNKTTL